MAQACEMLPIEECTIFTIYLQYPSPRRTGGVLVVMMAIMNMNERRTDKYGTNSSARRFRFDRVLFKAGRINHFHFPPLATVNSSMATLTKSHPVSPNNNLSSSIPAPFSLADRAYILQSSHSSNLHHPTTPTPSTHENSSHAQEAQAPGEVHLDVDGESPTAIQVSSLLCLRCGVICDLQSRIKMSYLQ